MTTSLCSSNSQMKMFYWLQIVKNQAQTKDLNKDPDGLWFLMEPQTHLAMALAPSLHPLQADILLSPPDYVSVAPTTWPNIKRASWVLKLLLTYESSSCKYMETQL